MILLFLQSLPPLHFYYHLYSNSKEGLLFIVLLQSLPPLVVPLSWEVSTMNIILDFCFHLN